MDTDTELHRLSYHRILKHWKTTAHATATLIAPFCIARSHAGARAQLSSSKTCCKTTTKYVYRGSVEGHSKSHPANSNSFHDTIYLPAASTCHPTACSACLAPHAPQHGWEHTQTTLQERCYNGTIIITVMQFSSETLAAQWPLTAGREPSSVQVPKWNFPWLRGTWEENQQLSNPTAGETWIKRISWAPPVGWAHAICCASNQRAAMCSVGCPRGPGAVPLPDSIPHQHHCCAACQGACTPTPNLPADTAGYAGGPCSHPHHAAQHARRILHGPYCRVGRRVKLRKVWRHVAAVEADEGALIPHLVAVVRR